MSCIRRAVLTTLAVLGVAMTLSGPAATADTKGGVLVLGGTGQLGSEVVRLLAARGESVTVFARPGSSREALAGLNVDYVTGDLVNAADVAAALKAKPFRAVINTVRVENNDIHFYEKVMANLAAAAKASGVTSIIHQSAVGAGDNAKYFTSLGWEKVPGLLDRLKDQGIGEDILKTSGLTYTIIRNSRVWPPSTPATGQAVLTEDQTVLTPMTRADLAKLTVDCLDNAACAGKVFHVRDPSLSWPPPRMQ